MTHGRQVANSPSVRELPSGKPPVDASTCRHARKPTPSSSAAPRDASEARSAMTRRSFTGAVLCGVAVLAWSGCGGAIRADELRRGLESLQSSAAEGQLLAEQVARGRSKVTFTRVHARSLGERVSHEAEKLSDAGAPASRRQAKGATVQLAQGIDDALGNLQVAPADRAVARQSARRLAGAAARAGRLAQGL
jgi:hypothetical protein